MMMQLIINRHQSLLNLNSKISSLQTSIEVLLSSTGMIDSMIFNSQRKVSQGMNRSKENTIMKKRRRKNTEVGLRDRIAIRHNKYVVLIETADLNNCNSYVLGLSLKTRLIIFEHMIFSI